MNINIIIVLLLFITMTVGRSNDGGGGGGGGGSNEFGGGGNNGGSEDCKDPPPSFLYGGTFDYICAGVGQAGSVIVSRLANAGHKVLGIEAGIATQFEVGGIDYVSPNVGKDSTGNTIVYGYWTRFDVPMFFGSTLSHYVDWPFYLNGAKVSSTVAKLLGGGGVHNGILWIRGTKASIDSWNVTGWSYDDLLYWYKYSENVTNSTTASLPNASYYHGFDGTIGVSDNPSPNATINPLTSQYYASIAPWLVSCNNTGLPLNSDFNGPSRWGCGTQVFNIRRGVRDSAARAYLPTALKTGKLTLSLNSEVTRILFHVVRGVQTAYGVEYVYNNATYRANATKEVIVAASAIMTPKLLMLSGIGPAAELTGLGIPVIYNNPNVGQGLRVNHGIFGSWNFTTPAPLPNMVNAADTYSSSGTGPWAHPGHQGYAYACLNKTLPCDDPDIMAAYQSTWTETTVTAQVETSKPQVRGVVSLVSANYTDPPNVTMNIFQYQNDLDCMVAGIKLHRQIFGSAPANHTFGVEISPGPTYVNDTQLETFVKNNAYVRYHWAGTAKVGNTGDPTAVVDRYMRVLGVNNLRVGDMSVIPSVNSHTQETAVLVGERCAAFIMGSTI